MNDLRIDLCGPELAAVVHRLTQEAFATHATLDPPSGAGRESLESVRDELAHEEAVVGWVGSRPVACMRMTAEGGHLHVRRLAISPDVQGLGLGRAMMAWAESAARDRGLSAVTVGVRLALTGNQAFFGRLGYEPVAERAHPGYDRPTWVEVRVQICGRQTSPNHLTPHQNTCTLTSWPSPATAASWATGTGASISSRGALLLRRMRRAPRGRDVHLVRLPARGLAAR